MPFKLRKAPKRELYWVVNTATGRKYSNDPISFENAQSQLRILEQWAEDNRERFHPEETDKSQWIQDVTSHMKTGAFTKQAKKAGMETEEFADYVLEHPDFFTVKTRRRAQFLVNIRHKVKRNVKGGMLALPEGYLTQWIDRIFEYAIRYPKEFETLMYAFISLSLKDLVIKTSFAITYDAMPEVVISALKILNLTTTQYFKIMDKYAINSIFLITIIRLCFITIGKMINASRIRERIVEPEHEHED